MATNEELTDAIAENLQKPKQASVDGQSVSTHSLPEQIEAAKFVAAENAKAVKGFGLSFAKIVPPGAV
jgi:hypothetical protein